MTNGRRTDPEDPLLRGPYHIRVLDPEAARLIAVHDVPTDRAWFRDNPGAPYRDRDASPRELKAYGFPPGTFVVVRVHRGKLFYFFAVHRPEFEELQARAGRPS